MVCSLLPTRKRRPVMVPFELVSTSGLTYEKEHEAEETNYRARRAGGCWLAHLGFSVAQTNALPGVRGLDSGRQALGCRESANSLGRTRSQPENRVQEQRAQSVQHRRRSFAGRVEKRA